MSEIEQQRAPEPLAGYDRGEVARYLGLNPNSPADRAMVAVCERYALDPVLKHVVVIPKSGVYITRDGLLHIAHRSGQLDGIVVEQAPVFDQRAGEWIARVSVYRKDMRHPFTFPGRYPANGTNKYPPEMALKAAEAHALRRAFAVTGMPTLDEQRHEEPAPGGLGAVLSTGGAEVEQQPAERSTPNEAVEVEPMFDVRSSWARGELFPALRAAEQAGMVTDVHDFVSEVVGREIASLTELTESEAHMVADNLPQAPS